MLQKITVLLCLLFCIGVFANSTTPKPDEPRKHNIEVIEKELKELTDLFAQARQTRSNDSITKLSAKISSMDLAMQDILDEATHNQHHLNWYNFTEFFEWTDIEARAMALKLTGEDVGYELEQHQRDTLLGLYKENCNLTEVNQTLDWANREHEYYMNETKWNTFLGDVERELAKTGRNGEHDQLESTIDTVMKRIKRLGLQVSSAGVSDSIKADEQRKYYPLEVHFRINHIVKAAQLINGQFNKFLLWLEGY